MGKLKHSFSLIPLKLLQTNTCKQDQEMESSEESAFLGSSFQLWEFREKILPGKKTGSIVGFFSLEGVSQTNWQGAPLFL